MKLCESSAVNEIGKISITGNVVPIMWFKNLRYSSGKPHVNAIIILSDIVYWYRPVEIRDELTGRLIGYKKKFKGDKLQRSRESYGIQFGLTKKQVKDALDFLSKIGVITKEVRNKVVTKTGMVLSNVLFIEPIVDMLKKITFEEIKTKDIQVKESDLQVTPSDLQGTTYTEITTETTNEIILENNISSEKNKSINNEQSLFSPDGGIEKIGFIEYVDNLQKAGFCPNPELKIPLSQNETRWSDKDTFNSLELFPENSSDIPAKKKNESEIKSNPVQRPKTGVENLKTSGDIPDEKVLTKTVKEKPAPDSRVKRILDYFIENHRLGEGFIMMKSDWGKFGSCLKRLLENLPDPDGAEEEIKKRIDNFFASGFYENTSWDFMSFYNGFNKFAVKPNNFKRVSSGANQGSNGRVISPSWEPDWKAVDARVIKPPKPAGSGR